MNDLSASQSGRTQLLRFTRDFIGNHGAGSLIVLGLLLLFLLSACGSAEVSPPLIPDEKADGQPLPPPEYKIQVGDQLAIKFYYNSELNEQVTVRPDGRISLQLIGEIMVVGTTPSELTAVLKTKYSADISNPEIAVIVTSFESQKVFVDGEVKNPGMIKITGTLSVLQSITSAGGLKDTALLRDVIVIRKNGNKPLVIPIDLRKAIAGDIEQDIVLKPYDIVYVPKTPIGYINQWVLEYLRNNVPFSFTFGYYF